MVMKLFDVFLGNSEVISKRYDALYGKKDHSKRIKKYRNDRLAVDLGFVCGEYIYSCS